MRTHNIFKAGWVFSIALASGLSAYAQPKHTSDLAFAQTASFRNDIVSNAEKSIATLPWRQFLANKELEALIDTALAKNNDLLVTIKDIEIANERFKKAKSGLLPEVGLSIASSNSIPSDNSLNGLTASQFLGANNLDNYTAALSVSWEADIWGKVKNQKREALAQYLQTQEARKGVQTMLVAGIATGYYNLLMLDFQLDIARKNLALYDSTLHIVRLQYASAMTSSLAVQQTEAQQLVAAQLVPKLEQAIIEQENALSVLIGIAPQAIPRTGKLDKLQMPEQIGVGLPADMLSRRPDVKSAELELNAASARIGLARAYMYPSLTISAQGGLNSLKTSNWFNLPSSLFGVVAGGIAQPLLQKRTLRTQYNVAKLQREQAVYQFRESVLTAYQEVADALVSVDKLGKQQVIAQARVDKLQTATGNAGMLFKNGMANYLEVLTAQGNALSGELELAAIRRAQLTAVIDLYRSLGGGWN